MNFDEQGKLGYWDILHPLYIIFNKENETFSGIWTEYEKSFSIFCKRYQEDVIQYSKIGDFLRKRIFQRTIFLFRVFHGPLSQDLT